MPRCRCNVCGSLTTTRYACKVCGSDRHLAHGHDKKHFEEVNHEWYATGGAHTEEVRSSAIPNWGAPVCDLVHRHPYTDPDHTHPDEELPTNVHPNVHPGN